jgi:hypothetical protein
MKLKGATMKFSFELRTGPGSCFWRLSTSDGREIVGAAPNAGEAALDVYASLGAIEPGHRDAAIAPALLDSALIWSGILEQFGLAIGASCVRA